MGILGRKSVTPARPILRKAVSYAYPMSPVAQRLGHPWTGCFYVVLFDIRTRKTLYKQIAVDDVAAGERLCLTKYAAIPWLDTYMKHPLPKSKKPWLKTRGRKRRKGE